MPVVPERVHTAFNLPHVHWRMLPPGQLGRLCSSAYGTYLLLSAYCNTEGRSVR